VARVRAAADELGYRPDPTARSLRTRRSGVAGVVVPDLTNPVLPPIVRGIEETLWRAGIACLLADTDNDEEREAALIEELRQRRCEGLIVASAVRTAEIPDLPTVLVTREAGSLPLVAADDASGVRAVLAHLHELSHTRIGHVTGPLTLSTTIRRLAAFGDEGPVVHGDAFTIAAGEKAAAQLLRGHPDITAIVAGNDMIALGCYAALAAAGLRCPEDVSVTGHNDMPLMDRVQPALTTVAIPQYELGVAAATTLLARLRGEPAGSTWLPTRLVVRASTSRPSRRRSPG
jgi:LacI family transcriptional regulator